MSRPRRVWRRVGIGTTWLVGLVAAAMVVAVVAFYQLSRVPSPTDLTFDQVATVTYADGSTMARIGSTNRSPVTLSTVPDHVRWAVLAAEDRGYYSEHGISVRGTLRAAVNDLKGGDTQGGSGITQQYVKNAYLNSERTLDRKLKELAIAVKLDRRYSKDQILAWYLNTIYLGRGAYGIQAASQAYFKTTVDKLTVSQGALLAGLIQAPSDADPANGPGLAQQRWSYVLDGMVSTGHLDPTARAKLRFPATVKPGGSPLGATGPTALIVNQVKAELTHDGIDESQLNTGGLRIQTTLDRTAQTDAESAVQQVYGDLTPQQHKDKLREALVAVNPASGGVLAYYGGSNGTGVDYAQAWRAPGSSFKPFTLAAVLGANLAGKQPSYAIDSVVDGSQPAQLPGLNPIYNDPGDAGYSYPTPITQAMKVSLNTVFARLADAVGPDTVAGTAHAAGVPATYTRSAYGDAGKKTLVGGNGHANATIGFGSYRVRPIDQADAFATFASGGVRHPSYFVAKVTDAHGTVLYQHRDDGKRVFDAKVANDVSLSMNQVASWSGDALADGRPTAAKTGTVGLDANRGGNSDAWMVGFTPQVSTAVWTGNDQTSVPALNKDGGDLYGRDMPGQAWKTFMDTYLSGKPQQPIPTQQQIFSGQDQAPAPTTPPSTAPSSAPPPTTPSSTTPSSVPPSTTPSSTTPPPTTPSSAPSSSTPSSTASRSSTSTMPGPPTTTAAPSTSPSAPGTPSTSTSTSAPPSRPSGPDRTRTAGGG